jgi:hypothetical protein
MSDTLAAGLLGAGAAIAGGLLSGAFQEAFNWFRRPILEIDFQDCSAKEPKSPYMPQGSWEVEGLQREWIVVRANIHNRGRRTAKNCRVYWIALNEVHDGKARPAGLRDSLPLPWAGWDFDPRDVPPKADAFLDVVRFRKDVGAWDFPIRSFFSNRSTLNNFAGVYRFRIVATADNASPAYCEIGVDYRKDWNNLRAWRVTK